MIAALAEARPGGTPGGQEHGRGGGGRRVAGTLSASARRFTRPATQVIRRRCAPRSDRQAAGCDGLAATIRSRITARSTLESRGAASWMM